MVGKTSRLFFFRTPTPESEGYAYRRAYESCVSLLADYQVMGKCQFRFGFDAVRCSGVVLSEHKSCILRGDGMVDWFPAYNECASNLPTPTEGDYCL